MGKFIRKNKLLKRVPWEIAVALTFNILILGVFLLLKSPPPQVVAPSEITVDISNFSPPEIKNMSVPETLAAGGAASEPVPANPEKLTENAMRDFSSQITGSVSMTDKTATERFGELARTAQGIAVFDGVSNIRSGLPSGMLPAGLEVGASFAGRGDAANRSRLLRRHGGNVQTESAVEKALKYLASVQNRNGSWGSKESFATGDAAALSSLALLAFFSHGENFQSKQYGDHIRRGCDFLVELSNTQNIEYAGNGFGHAILTYALAEGYAVSGSLSLRHALEARLKFIISRQNSFGSFALNYDNTPMAPPTADQLEDPLFKEIVIGEPGCDLSLLGWHIQALTAAHNAGVRPDGLDKALSLATEALVKIHQADKGGFSQGINLKRFGANDNMNPVGLLGLQLLNSGNSSPARRAEKILLEVTPPKWKNSGRFPLYRWYYQTQALFQTEKGRGKRWEEWNENLKKELLAAQNSDGSWSLPGGDASFRVKGRTDLTVYGSSLCALMLQVYYRYLPSYSIAENSTAASRADDYDIGGAGLITRLPGGADPLAGVILGLGENEFEPIAFGRFDGRPADNALTQIEDEFSKLASMRSTVAIRKTEDWPQTLQPNQRLALFLDELIPRSFKGHLRLTLGMVGSVKEAFDEHQSLEAVINGKRLYNSILLRNKQLVEIVIPSDVMQPFGNILQLRNNGKAVLAFDAARITAINKVGARLYLLAEDAAELQPSIRPLFAAKEPDAPVICNLDWTSKNHQLMTVAETYDPKKIYIASYTASGSEHMGNEYQRHYLQQTGREIVDWISGGGSGVKLRNISRSSRFYDSVFGTEYPALSALRQVAKLFDGTPHKLAAQYYPKYDDKPQLFGNAAAAYNAPGVATVVVTKRFLFPEEGEVVAIVPWNGATEMIIEKGFLPENSPFTWLAAKVQSESRSINIENNIFRYSCPFPELTVIRLIKKGAKEPTRPPVVRRDIWPQIQFDYTSPKNTLREKALKKHSFRLGGYAAAYGQNASFSRIPVTKEEKFTPGNKESIVITHRVNADVPGRFDSVYLALGQAPEEALYLSFWVFPRASGVKKDERYPWTQMRFALDKKCFSVSLSIDRWQQVFIPLDGIIPSWQYLRILGPGRTLEKNLRSISYEINDISVWCK